MPAVVQVNEYNGAGSTKTPNVPRGDWLSADLPGDVDRRNTNYLQKPTSGLTRSFEKWQKLELTNLSGSVKLDLFRHYLAAPLPTGFAAYTSAVNPATSPPPPPLPRRPPPAGFRGLPLGGTPRHEPPLCPADRLRFRGGHPRHADE